jgi:Ca2+-binding RTX toxin-like protein
MTLTALNATDNDGGTNNGDLVINYSLPNGATSAAQTITVANHFDTTTAGTGVERINFNNATYAGYLLGADDYVISRLDPNNRDAGGVNLATSLANNFVVGEQGVNDVITGGLGNDLIFGGTGDNDLIGGRR